MNVDIPTRDDPTPLANLLGDSMNPPDVPGQLVTRVHDP